MRDFTASCAAYSVGVNVSSCDAVTENVVETSETASSRVSKLSRVSGSRHNTSAVTPPTVNTATFPILGASGIGTLSNRERKCADAIGTVLVTWAGHFQC